MITAKQDDTDEFICSLLGGVFLGFGGLLFLLGTIFGVVLLSTDPESWGPGKGPGIEIYLLASFVLLGIARFFFWLIERS